MSPGRTVRFALGAGLIAIAIAMHQTARAADASPQVIYGRDTRIEVNRLAGARAELARATAGLMAGNQQLAGQTITLQPKTLQQAFGLCADQRFAQQPVQAFCSAVLVAPDVVLTAGHCIKAGDSPRGAPLDEILVVFGFQMLPSGKPRLRIAGRDVYAAKELVKRVENGDSQPDWALLRLDRPVVRRNPVPLAPDSTLVAGLPVYVIGHPSGLPMKFAKGATITTLQDRYLFANLDTFSGNSGSPVFDARSNRLVGVLDEGQEDYVARGPCKVVNLVPQVPGKEGVTRVGVFRDEIGRLP